MTKNEAKALFEKASDSAINYKDSTEVISIDSAFIIIKRIYDDFEKQKSCEGCVHHISANGNIPLSCCECSRFYADRFEDAIEPNSLF
jgi:hypothetical protein